MFKWLIITCLLFCLQMVVKASIPHSSSSLFVNIFVFVWSDDEPLLIVSAFESVHAVMSVVSISLWVKFEALLNKLFMNMKGRSTFWELPSRVSEMFKIHIIHYWHICTFNLKVKIASITCNFSVSTSHRSIAHPTWVFTGPRLGCIIPLRCFWWVCSGVVPPK